MIIETKNLVKIYGERKVVNNVSLQVEQGTIVGLLGPNGPERQQPFIWWLELQNRTPVQ